MGKLINYIAMLVAIDLLFLITGQYVLNSNLSLIIGALTDPSTLTTGSLWKSLILEGGLASVGLAGGVLTGVITRDSNLVFVAVSITFASLLIGDYIGIYNILRSHNPILAMVVMAPIIIIFAFVMVEWARGKD